MQLLLACLLFLLLLPLIHYKRERESQQTVMMMDLINAFLNLTAPPFTFFSILFLLPPYLFLKFLVFLLRSLFIEDIAGKVVLITGASSGIGESVAYEYAMRGACLVLAARRVDKLGEVGEMARELGSPHVLTLPADVSKLHDCRRIVDETIAHFGRLDHLVNNAGFTCVCMFEESEDLADMRPVMETNFWGSAYMARFAIPHLRNTRGKIIGLASAAGWLPTPRMSIYNASKAALISLYETLRVELGTDIGITIVTPGLIESEMTQGKFLKSDGRMEVDQELRDALISAIPVGSVEKCAKAIVNSGLRGDRYLTQPAWFRVTYYWKLFFPALVEWLGRLVYGTSRGGSLREAPTKKILDLTGAQKILYPSSIQTPERKAD